MLPCTAKKKKSFSYYSVYSSPVTWGQFFLCFGKKWKRMESFLILERFPAIRTRNIHVAMLVLMCSFKYLFPRNFFPVISHVSACCLNVLQHLFSWFLSWWKKPPQYLQIAYSSLWVPLCLRRWYAFFNLLSHLEL